jgi:hypothetical protein
VSAYRKPGPVPVESSVIPWDGPEPEPDPHSEAKFWLVWLLAVTSVMVTLAIWQVLP